MIYIAAFHIGGIHRIPHPLLIPPYLVHAVVVAAARTVGRLVEIAMQEHRRGTFLAAGRSAEDAHIVGIHVGIALGGRLYPQLAVGQSGIFQVLVAHFLKLLPPPTGSHGIELHHDEAQFCQCGHVSVEWRETLGRVGAARSRIDVFDYGVATRWVEVDRALDDAPHIGLAITALGHKHLRGFPSVGCQA